MKENVTYSTVTLLNCEIMDIFIEAWCVSDTETPKLLLQVFTSVCRCCFASRAKNSREVFRGSLTGMSPKLGLLHWILQSPGENELLRCSSSSIVYNSARGEGMKSLISDTCQTYSNIYLCFWWHQAQVASVHSWAFFCFKITANTLIFKLPSIRKFAHALVTLKKLNK